MQFAHHLQRLDDFAEARIDRLRILPKRMQAFMFVTKTQQQAVGDRKQRPAQSGEQR